MAVIANRPFAQAGLFSRACAASRCPQRAGEIECQNWAEVFLKYVISHPAVTCAIPATPIRSTWPTTLGRRVGRMPDEQQRRRMAAYFDRL